MQPVLLVEAFSVAASARRFALPSLQLGAGECAALFAPSGSGKTSILRGLFAANGAIAGRVRVADVDFAAADAAGRRECLRTRIAVMSQDAVSALDPFRSLARQVAAATGAGSESCRSAFARLAAADEPPFLDRLPHEVSGGQAQRALFAVAALRRAALVVCDEPTANLDDASAARVAAMLQELRHAGSALLVATHDLRLLRALDPNVLVETPEGFCPGIPGVAPWPRREAPLAQSPVVLSARGLVVRRGDTEVLQAVDFDLRAGEVVAVHGPSGSGKTTLLRALAGRAALAAGTIERPARRTAVQLVSQDAGGSLTPSRSVRSLVAEVAVPGFLLDETARRLGLTDDVLLRTTSTISGGERRRAALLRALAVEPEVLLLDEPTASLDRDRASELVAALLAQATERRTAIALVTHDEELAGAAAHRVLRLAGGTWQH